MEQVEFESHIETIMYEEGWQTKKGQTVASSITNQRRAINKIAKALDLKPLNSERVIELSFG